MALIKIPPPPLDLFYFFFCSFFWWSLGARAHLFLTGTPNKDIFPLFFYSYSLLWMALIPLFSNCLNIYLYLYNLLHTTL